MMVRKLHHPVMRVFTFTLALILFVGVSSAQSTASAKELSYTDIDHRYDTGYKLDSNCPDVVEVSNLKVDSDTNIGRILVKDIKEDGMECSGAGFDTMHLVSKATAQNSALLKRIGFPEASTLFDKNTDAKSFLNNKKQTTVTVGFDQGVRTCGSKKYSASTAYFFFQATAEFRIDVKQGPGSSGNRTAIFVPPGTRAFLIEDGNRKLCLLYDKSSSNGQKVRVILPGQPIPEPTPEPKPSASPSKKPAPKQSVPKQPVQTKPQTTSKKSPEPTPSTSKVPEPSSERTSTGSEPLVTPEPTSGPTTTPSPGAVCFPGHATVELESGVHVPMSALRLGDRVRTGSGSNSFSDVYMFTHRSAGTHHNFVRLVTASRAAVTLTSSHYLYASGNMVAAGSVAVGDVLTLYDGTKSAVIAVESVSALGLYNPHTLVGDIVVNGVLTSTYTTAVDPDIAHTVLLAPLRALYNAVGANSVLQKLSDVIDAGASRLATLVPSGPSLVL